MPAGAGTKIHAKNAAIYINGGKSGGSFGSGQKISNKTEVTLNLSRDYVDATTFGNTNKVYLTGLKDISGTYAGLLDVSGDIGVNASDLDAVPIYIYADDRAGHEILLAYGPGLIDASISLSNTDAAKTTGNFRAAGDWTVFSDGSL